MWRGAFLLTALAVAAAGCKGSTGRLGPGEECNSSAECQDGLLCDFGVDPPVCSMDFTEPPDAGPDAMVLGPDAGPVPDAMPGAPDARPVDAAVMMPDANVMTPDAGVPDASIPDASPPDA